MKTMGPQVQNRIERPLLGGNCVLFKGDCCECIHFEYGCIHMTLDHEGLHSFARVIDHLSRKKHRKDCLCDKFYLQLNGLNMKLVFRTGEVGELGQMLTCAKRWLREMSAGGMPVTVH